MSTPPPNLVPWRPNRWTTTVMAIVLAGALGSIAYSVLRATEPRIARAAETVIWLQEATLEAAHAPSPSWYRTLADEQDMREAVEETISRWTDVLATPTPQAPSAAALRARLIVLLAEHERHEAARGQFERLKEENAPLLVRALPVAYPDVLASTDEQAGDANALLLNEVARSLSAHELRIEQGYTFSRVMARLWKARGDEQRAQEWLRRSEARGRARQQKLLGWLAFIVALLLGAIVASVQLWRRRHVLPPPWAPGATRAPYSGWLAAAAMIHGLFYGALLATVLAVLSGGTVLLAAPALFLPSIYFVRRITWERGYTLTDALGLRPFAGRTREIAIATLAVAGIELLLSLTVGAVAAREIGKGPWYESVPRDLVWAGPVTKMFVTLAVAVVAPLAEEIVFRGLVFATLRRRLPFLAAATASAALFAVAHLYSPAALAVIFSGALVSAWAFERTGSLWPAIGAHALNNLLWSASIFIRF